MEGGRAGWVGWDAAADGVGEGLRGGEMEMVLTRRTGEGEPNLLLTGERDLSRDRGGDEEGVLLRI